MSDESIDVVRTIGRRMLLILVTIDKPTLALGHQAMALVDCAMKHPEWGLAMSQLYETGDKAAREDIEQAILTALPMERILPKEASGE